MPIPVDVKARPNYHLWLRYSDGVEGDLDLSGFAGHGVFKAWNESVEFADVTVGDQGQIKWNDELELCPDSLYMRLTGKSPEEVFPNLGEMSLNA